MEKAKEAYSNAQNLATEKLAATNPIRLGLALNFSVFFYEIANNAAKAVELAKKVRLYLSVLNPLRPYYRESTSFLLSV